LSQLIDCQTFNILLIMKNSLLVFGTLVILGMLTMATRNIKTSHPQRSNVVTSEESAKIERGKYLVMVGGCDDCHSPKRMGPRGPEIVPETRFGGYPSDRPIQKVSTDALKNGWALMGGDLTSAVGPWGMSFGANISSDETGIGTWSEQQFLTALRKGKYKGIETSRDLLPPMPWYNYANMKEEDLKAMYAYLKSTKPVKNIVPTPITPDKLK
jgi:Cytochrome c